MYAQMDALELSPQEAQSRLASGAARLIDVREPEEFQAAFIAGAELIPMRSVPAEYQRLERWADQQALLVLCHHGVRSLQVTSWLRDQGVENCFSVIGGIDRWSLEIDSRVPRY